MLVRFNVDRMLCCLIGSFMHIDFSDGYLSV